MQLLSRTAKITKGPEGLKFYPDICFQLFGLNQNLFIDCLQLFDGKIYFFPGCIS